MRRLAARLARENAHRGVDFAEVLRLVTYPIVALPLLVIALIVSALGCGVGADFKAASLRYGKISSART